MSNPKPDIYNINAYTKYGENPLIFTHAIVRKQKYGVWRADNSCQKLRKFAHKQSQARSQQYQCKCQGWWKSIDIYSSYRLETKIQMCGGWTFGRADGRTDGHTEVQREAIIPRHYCVAGYKNGRRLYLGVAPDVLPLPRTTQISWHSPACKWHVKSDKMLLV